MPKDTLAWRDLSTEYTECYQSALQRPYYLILCARLDTAVDRYRVRYIPLDGEPEHAPAKFADLRAAKAWCETHVNRID